jgi:hypothetical protein
MRTKHTMPSARKKISGVCCHSACDETAHTQVPRPYAAATSSARRRGMKARAVR